MSILLWTLLSIITIVLLVLFVMSCWADAKLGDSFREALNAAGRLDKLR